MMVRTVDRMVELLAFPPLLAVILTPRLSGGFSEVEPPPLQRAADADSVPVTPR
jgi:hypothetical protein